MRERGPSSAGLALRGLCGGALHLPGDPGYDLARTPWNTAVDQRPAAVAYPADPAEVAALIVAARAAGLRIAPQGTGHDAGALEPLDGTVLLRTAAMTGLSVDHARRRARVGAGMLWADVVEALTPLAALHPAAPDVGVVGYSLAGGLGWYARQLGLQSNSVTAVELVTATGEAVRADATRERELFWALRGGGANFGVVTAIEFALHPIAAAYAGVLAWDWKHADVVLPRWVSWAAGAPTAITTSLRIVQHPSSGEVPAQLRGRRLVIISGAVLGEAEAVLAPLRALRPELDTFATVPAAALLRLHQEPEGPRPGGRESLLFDTFPSVAVDAFLTAAGPGSGSALRTVELRQLGGALALSDPAAGALSHVDGQFLLVVTPDSGPAVTDACGLVESLASHATAGRYLGFAGTRGDARAAFEPATWARLRTVRAAVDPDGLFVASHPIPPVR